MKQRTTVLAMLVIVLVVLAGCGADDDPPPAEPTAQPTTVAPQPAPAGDATSGQQFFLASCSACHGPNGQGVVGLGKDMTKSEFIAGLSDTELRDFIRRGRPIDDPLNTTGVMMPPSGGNPALSDAQLMDIIAYIRSIHQ
jgi:mono/diheme cytochrome c family protein